MCLVVRLFDSVYCPGGFLINASASSVIAVIAVSRFLIMYRESDYLMHLQVWMVVYIDMFIVSLA